MTDVPAWRDPATRAAWRNYVGRSSAMALFGAAGIVAGLVLGVEVFHGSTGARVPSVGLVLFALSTIPMATGGLALANTVRMWSRLRRDPWIEYGASYRQVFDRWYVRNGTPTLVLDTEDSPVLTIVALEWRLRHVSRTDTVVVAGNPRRSTVVAPRPGGPLIWARAPR